LKRDFKAEADGHAKSNRDVLRERPALAPVVPLKRLSHLHNAVVNRQRQNSLMTFKALVEAAGQQENRDIILTKAADSIFAPQPTGFSKADGAEGAATSVISLGSGALRGTPS
jgi:hypothetical protein